MIDLGTTIETALSKVGIDHDKVNRWLGRECGCRERRDKLDSLGHWAERVVRGRVAGMKQFLQQIMDE